MKKTTLLLTLLISSITVFAQNNKPIQVPQIAMKVGLQQTIDINGLQIEFLEVLEDSRCPRNTTCVQAGQAKIKVKITDSTGKAKYKTLTFTNTTSPVMGLFDGVQLTALKLNPYPDANISKSKRAPYSLSIHQETIEEGE